MEHTYTLAALYPYATRPEGEWAYQAAVAYTFKKGSLLGGKYGTTAKVNFSHVHSVRKNGAGDMGTDGYGSPFWHGEMLPIIKTLIYSWKSDLLKIRNSI